MSSVDRALENALRRELLAAEGAIKTALAEAGRTLREHGGSSSYSPRTVCDQIISKLSDRRIYYDAINEKLKQVLEGEQLQPAEEDTVLAPVGGDFGDEEG